MSAGTNYNKADGGRTGETVAFPGSVDNIPDMRGIKETAERFKLPVHFVRELVKSGKVVAVRAGSKKFYINQSSMIAFLNGGGQGWQT